MLRVTVSRAPLALHIGDRKHQPVTNVYGPRWEVQAKLDRVEAFLRHHSVPTELSHKLVSYFKYICLNSQARLEYS